jgi:hypothetical protein
LSAALDALARPHPRQHVVAGGKSIEIVAQVIVAGAGAVTPTGRFGAEDWMPAYLTITPGTYRSASPAVLALISSRNCCGARLSQVGAT